MKSGGEDSREKAVDGADDIAGEKKARKDSRRTKDLLRVSELLRWQKVGEVVDAVGAGKKKVHNGKEYDYVFDVDIQDGVPPLKLPYNVTGKHENHLRRFASNNYYIAENPFAAAQ